MQTAVNAVAETVSDVVESAGNAVQDGLDAAVIKGGLASAEAPSERCSGSAEASAHSTDGSSSGDFSTFRPD